MTCVSSTATKEIVIGAGMYHAKKREKGLLYRLGKSFEPEVSTLALPSAGLGKNTPKIDLTLGRPRMMSRLCDYLGLLPAYEYKVTPARIMKKSFTGEMKVASEFLQCS